MARKAYAGRAHNRSDSGVIASLQRRGPPEIRMCDA